MGDTCDRVDGRAFATRPLGLPAGRRWSCRGRRPRVSTWLGLIILLILLLTDSAIGGPAQAASASTALADDQPEAIVLFINSYHRGYAWSDGIEEGVREVFAASDKTIEVSYEYLDSRRFAFGKQMDAIANAMEIKYAEYRPDLVLVSDNAAFDFAIKYRARLFPDQPIVFCGYNLFRPEVLDGIANVTGVNEEMSITGTIDLALGVHPRTRTLVFVTSTGDDTSRRISALLESMLGANDERDHELVILQDTSLEALGRGLTKLPAETLVFLSGQISDQAAGRAFSPLENGRLVSAISPFPVYTFWDFHLNTGVLGGRILTGRDQGRAAADLALRILAGTPADAIPVVMTSPTTDIFDDQVMRRFGISRSALPADALIINQPFSVWEAYRWPIIGGVALVVAETLLIGLLLVSMRERRQALTALATERATLERRVVERTRDLAAANAQLARLSMTDSLTTLANRRRFDEALVEEFQRLRRSGASLSLILIDLDHFKPYNDHYGHVAGDECLRRVGTLIGEVVRRPPDLAARYGGEELAAILPETNADDARQVAERIRAGIASLAIPHAASAVADHVTASLGVVTLVPTEAESPIDLIHLADEQLYRAKSEGRNRIAVASVGGE